LYWVAAYLSDLQWGGPEEGGWYYDTATLVTDPDIYRTLGRGAASFADAAEAAAHAEAMERHLPLLNHQRPPKHSVASVGVYEIRVLRSATLPLYLPETPPRYE
ncbi:MAG: hypothetical protein ACREFP_01845, partial [Acetobacteraceae bacterium]